MNLEFCCPTLFGLEGIVADELRFGGKLTDVRAENGRVFFTGDERTLIWSQSEFALCRAGSHSAGIFSSRLL